MKKINPLELFLWTFRRKEKDVVNLYDSLSDLMRLATGADMLNFGYWDDKTRTPLDAQKKMCTIFGKKALLSSEQNIVDVGSGFSSPAIQWSLEYSPVKLSCVNINFTQLHDSIKNVNKSIKTDNINENFNFLNATATTLPFEKESVERVLALESAQHFKPLKNFISESYRILKKNGILTLAIPVMAENHYASMIKLGSLSITWPSEHYSTEFVNSNLKQERFRNIDLQKIGSNVYEPLAKYYIENREYIKNKILQYYPAYVEKILFKSLNKMKQVSEKKIIDYILVSCQK
ncbi:MAG: class I SAM-dependent methyltransferase [Nitrososphaerota archaeon]|jgi:ubiquinone/menaquinone biosynthesis C-methylase UbiE|nr:class I SAM-dependent methyltransferase [Nitrososphaerota archaeon]